MKTNQVMIRPMGQFKVEQRTKDAYLILFVLALNIYTPKDVVDKIENHVTQQESK